MRALVNKDFKFYLFFSLHHWLPMLVAALIAGGAAFTICKFYLKPRYAAKTTLYIGRGGERGTAPGNDVAVPELHVRTVPAKEKSTSDVEELRNAVVNLRAGIEMVTDLQLLIQTRRFKKNVNEKFMELHGGREPMPYEIDVSNPKNSRYLMLSVSSESVVEAVELANLMGDVFLVEIDNLLGVHNSQVIDRAEMPKMPTPFYPRVKIAVIVTAFFAAAGILLFFFFCYFFDSRLNGTGDLQEAVQLPVLGEIPLDTVLVQEIEKGVAANHIVSTLDAKTGAKHANVSEAYRMLRNNIRYTDTKKSDTEGRVLAITGSVPGEGKSFIASNLAVSFAELGYRTLIINCDLHKATFHLIFGIAPHEGLVDILSSGESFDQCVIRHYMDLPMDILQCGPTPPNPAKLLDSAAFRDLLSQLKQHYQYIFLDAPPVSAVADTTILGKLADGVIVVVRDHYTREEALKAAVEQLRLVDVEIFGVIMNGVESRHRNYYGYDYEHSAKSAQHRTKGWLASFRGKRK